MYALMTMFQLGPGMKAAADRLGEQFAPVLKARPGFKGATFCLEEDIGECVALSLWEAREDAEGALAATAAGLQEAVKDIIKEPPYRRIYEVWGQF